MSEAIAFILSSLVVICILFIAYIVIDIIERIIH